MKGDIWAILRRDDGRHGPELRNNAVIYVLGALGALLFGYDTGIIAAAILFIKTDLHIGPTLQGFVVSSILVGAMIGALSSGPVSDRFGRRTLLALAGAIFTGGALGAALAPDVGVLIAFRFILGLAVGIASVGVPVYLAELAPTERRGVLTSLNQYMIIVGVAVAGGVGYGLSFPMAWRWMLGIGVIPAVVLLAAAALVPESPRWLVRRGHEDRAREVLRGLRGPGRPIDGELTDIKNIEQTEREHHGRLTTARSRWVRRLVLLGIGLAIGQQITGINTIVYYAPTTLTKIGLSSHTALLFTFLNGVLNIVTITVMVKSGFVDRFGRKPVLLIGTAGLTVSLLALGIAALVVPPGTSLLAYIAIASFVVYTNTFSATWGPTLWTVLSEIFPLWVRGRAMGLSTMFNWVSDFFVSLTFPIFAAMAGSGPVIVAYAAMGFVVFPFVAFLVPETRDRSLEEIETDLRHRMAA